MGYIPPEVVAKIKQIDLYTYLKYYEPNELEHIAGTGYRMKSNHSLKISNGLWNDFSAGYGGKNALDFLIKVRGYEFKEALKFLMEKTKIEPINYDEIEKYSHKNLEEKR